MWKPYLRNSGVALATAAADDDDDGDGHDGKTVMPDAGAERRKHSAACSSSTALRKSAS